MPVKTTEIRRRLAAFDFTGLLVEELGWNRYRAIPLDILVDTVAMGASATGPANPLWRAHMARRPNQRWFSKTNAALFTQIVSTIRPESSGGSPLGWRNPLSALGRKKNSPSTGLLSFMELCGAADSTSSSAIPRIGTCVNLSTSSVDIQYSTTETGNLYAPMLERALALGHLEGREGFIVPVSSVSTDGYLPLQRLLTQRRLHFSSYDDRPSRLFDGLEHIRLTIHVIGRATATPVMHSTRYHKWSRGERELLFERLNYAESRQVLIKGTLPKLSSSIECDIVDKLEREKRALALAYSQQGPELFYSRKLGYFLQVLDFEPLVLDGKGNRRPPSEFKVLRFANQLHRDAALCALNSSLFYWFVTVFSDCRHLNKREIDAFPLDVAKLSEKFHKPLSSLARRLLQNLKDTSEERVMQFRHDSLTVQCIIPRSSKPSWTRSIGSSRITMASIAFTLTSFRTTTSSTGSAKRISDLAP